MSPTDEPDGHGILLSDGATVWLPAVPPRDDVEVVEPEEVVVRVTDDVTITIGPPSKAKRSRWGRRVAELSTSEWRSLLQTLDSATRAFIEAQRWTGALVELDPLSRAMWKSGLFEAFTEDGDWFQASLRDDDGRFARVMRIRPATGLTAMAGPVAVLGAIAAQAQAVEVARDIKAIRHRVDAIIEKLNSVNIGAVEHAVEQAEALVELLRLHGQDGVRESDVPISRHALGDARHKCMNHLKDAVARLETAKEQESARQAAESVSSEAVQEVMLYLGLLGKLYVATVQFGFAEVALDYHAGKPHVAKDRGEQIARSIDAFRNELADILDRLGELDHSVHARFLPLWRHAIKQIPASALAGAGIGAAAPVVAALKADIEGDSDNDEGDGADQAADKNPLAAAAVTGAVGGVVGAVYAGHNVVAEHRAQKTLDKRLEQLAAVASASSTTMDQAAPSLEALQTLTAELAGPREQEPLAP